MTNATNAPSDVNVPALIAQLRENMRAAELKLAQVPGSQWVIMWGDHPLRTDGNVVALCGPSIYTGTRALMEQEAQRFAQNVPQSEFPEPVRAMSSTDALATLIEAHKRLLASLPGTVKA